MSYSGVFSLSYANYCNEKGITEVPQETIDKWVEDSVSRFYNVNPGMIDTHLLFNMFEIEENGDNTYKLINNYYKVTLDSADNDKGSMSILMKFTLEFTE